MSRSSVQVFVATFDNEKQADEALAALRRMDREGTLDLIDAAAIVRREDGKITFTESGDPSAKKWAARGAVAGGLVGLIFPPSLLLSAAVGGGAGGIWGKIRDKGFDDAELKKVGETLEPGGSAIIAIAEDRVIERLQQGIADYRELASYALDADAAAVLSAEVETITTADVQVTATAKADPAVPAQGDSATDATSDDRSTS